MKYYDIGSIIEFLSKIKGSIRFLDGYYLIDSLIDDSKTSYFFLSHIECLLSHT